jgi:hypothetical protein
MEFDPLVELYILHAVFISSLLVTLFSLSFSNSGMSFLTLGQLFGHELLLVDWGN